MGIGLCTVIPLASKKISLFCLLSHWLDPLDLVNGGKEKRHPALKTSSVGLCSAAPAVPASGCPDVYTQFSDIFLQYLRVSSPTFYFAFSKEKPIP